MAVASLFVMRACALVWLLLLLLLQNGVDAERALSAASKHHLAAAPLHIGTVRTIQSPDGDIVDCTQSYHQPALQHPLLKNHTIQELPSSIQLDDHTTSKTQDQYSSYEIFQVWHQNERCPFGTIPILRKDPLEPVHKKHASYPTQHPHKFSSTSKNIKEHSLSDAKSPNHEYAVANFLPTNTLIYGATVILNQWNPLVELDNEFSLSQMWISAGKFEGTDLNTIEVGWQVYPTLYQDRATRLFIYWTADYYATTGCYNLECPGFVQVDNTIVLGGALNISSNYEGAQVELPQILVQKDPQTHNWWLRYGMHYLGYWPKEIFTHLADYGERVQWGGEVVNDSPGGFHTSTQMGSGHFANDGYKGACYARGLAYIDSTNTVQNISLQELTTLATNPSCYNIELKFFMNSTTGFFFGGPGKNPDCT